MLTGTNRAISDADPVTRIDVILVDASPPKTKRANLPRIRGPRSHIRAKRRTADSPRARVARPHRSCHGALTRYPTSPLSSLQASSPSPATATPSSSPPSTTPPRSAPSPTRTASECSLSIEPFLPLHPSPVALASWGGEGTPRLTGSFLPSFLSQLRGQLRRGEQHLRAR